jgi:hypothetical protein
MLQNPAILPDRRERRREAPAVIPALVTPPLFNEPSEPTPSRAGRMSDDGPRASIKASVARRVPRIDAAQARI